MLRRGECRHAIHSDGAAGAHDVVGERGPLCEVGRPFDAIRASGDGGESDAPASRDRARAGDAETARGVVRVGAGEVFVERIEATAIGVKRGVGGGDGVRV